MKTIVNTFLCFLLLASSAFAEPYLQLDASNSTYDDTEDVENIVPSSDIFTLYALVNTRSPDYRTAPDNEQYYISIALTPKVPNSQLSDSGFFVFNEKSYYVSAIVSDNKNYGTPNGLAPHSIFETYYIEHNFSSFTGKANQYNVQDTPGKLTVDNSGTFQYAAFEVNTSFLHNYDLHFDLYTKNANGSIKQFAPPSHDVESGGEPTDNPVPEPASILLLGFGLIGLARIGRKKLL